MEVGRKKGCLQLKVRDGKWDKTSCSNLSGFCCDHLCFELLRLRTASAGWMAGIQTLAPLWVRVRKLQGTQQGQEIFLGLSSVMREGAHTLANLFLFTVLPALPPPPLGGEMEVRCRAFLKPGLKRGSAYL